MLGNIYVFSLTDPFLRVPRLQPMRCLHDGEAVDTVRRLPGVVRVTEGGRQVWPRPAPVPAHPEPRLHDFMDDGA